MPVVAPLSDDDGNVSPEFDLPSDEDSDDAPPPAKRHKMSASNNRLGVESPHQTLEDEEILALRLLRQT